MNVLTGCAALLQAQGVRVRFLLVIILASVPLLGGCRQSDGDMPVAEGEVPARLSDLTRDLLNVAAHTPTSRQEFIDDLAVFADDKPAEGVVATFGARVTEAVEQAKLTEPAAQQLAHAVWVVIAGTDLSARQVEAARNDLKQQLTTAGVSAERSDAVAAEVANVQDIVNTRQRRWYEVF